MLHGARRSCCKGPVPPPNPSPRGKAGPIPPPYSRHRFVRTGPIPPPYTSHRIAVRLPVGGVAIAAAASPRSGRWQPLQTQRKVVAHLPPPHACTTLPCTPRHPAGRVGGARTRPKVRHIPTPAPRERTHAVCCRPPVGGLAIAAAASARTGLWRPPDTRHKDRSHPSPRRTHRRAHRATQLSARAARVDARGLSSGASPPPSTQARQVSSRPPVGGLAVAAAESSRSWRGGRRGTHSAYNVLGGSPPPHQRPRRCVPRHSAGCASGGRGGTWALVRRIPPPPPPGGTRAVAARPPVHRPPRGRPPVGGLVVAAAASARSVRWRQTLGRLCSLDWLDWLDGDSRLDC